MKIPYRLPGGNTPLRSFQVYGAQKGFLYLNRIHRKVDIFDLGRVISHLIYPVFVKLTDV